MATLNQIELNKLKETERHNKAQEYNERIKAIGGVVTGSVGSILNPLSKLKRAGGASAIIPW